MAVRSKDEILELIRARVGDDVSDDALKIIEDVTDTLDDYETRVADSTDWKARYEQNDADWRKKYKDRFFNKGNDPEEDPEREKEEEEEKEPVTFEDLFTTEED